MSRRFDHPPTAPEIEAIARDALAGLPSPYAEHLGAIVLQVDEEAEPELLAELGIEHPPMIHLYRIPLLVEWVETGVALEDLITHVIVHEVGHHFGLSDADMHALEDQAG